MLFSSFFHWTTSRHGNLATLVPCAYILYYNAHYTTIFQRYFVKPSKLGKITDDISDMFEQELRIVSENRELPLTEAKYSLTLCDNLESKTNGSLHLTTTTLFRLTSRIGLNDIATIRQLYPNIMTLVSGSSYKGQPIDTSSLNDEDLKKFLLSPNSKKYAIAREIIRSDSLAGLGIPITLYFITCLLTFPILFSLRNYVSASLAFTFSTILTFTIFIPICKLVMDFQERVYDKIAFSIGDSYIEGCRDYLKRSMEIGKLLYELGEKKIFTANGDCNSHQVSYSKRLAYLEDYQRKKKAQKKSRSAKAS